MRLQLKHGVPPAGKKLHFTSTAVIVDGEASLAAAYVHSDGFLNTATIHVAKFDRNGAQVGPEGIIPVQDAGEKVDAVSLAQSGPNLLVVYTSHVGDYDTRWWLDVLPNFCTPYPHGQEPQVGMPGFAAQDQPPPTPDPFDYERIQRMITAGIDAFDQRLGGAAPREDIKGLIDGEIARLQVLTLLLTSAGGDYGYYMQQVNTAFTGCLGALHEAGLFHAPEEHAIATQARDLHNQAEAAAMAQAQRNLTGENIDTEKAADAPKDG